MLHQDSARRRPTVRSTEKGWSRKKQPRSQSDDPPEKSLHNPTSLSTSWPSEAYLIKSGLSQHINSVCSCKMGINITYLSSFVQRSLCMVMFPSSVFRGSFLYVVYCSVLFWLCHLLKTSVWTWPCKHVIFCVAVFMRHIHTFSH